MNVFFKQEGDKKSKGRMNPNFISADVRRLLLGAGCFLLSVPVLAAESDSLRVNDLDEVIIVAQPKENLRLRQQPLSSTMFSSQDMENLGGRDLRDLSAFVPSFTMPNYGSRLTSSMYIRGIGSRINNPAVGVYVDGLPIVSKNAYNFHAYQLGRVDVLRGPQGTLYGMNTEGGLVRLYSRNPMTNPGTEMNFGVGTKGLRKYDFAHHGKVCDRFAFSAAGFYEAQDGFFKNEFTGDHADQYEEAGGKLRLMWQPVDRLLLDFITDYQYVNQNGFAYGLLSTDGTTANPSTNRQSNYRRNMLNTGLKLKYQFSGFDFYSTTSWQFLKDNMLMDQDYLPDDYMHLVQRQHQNALTEELTLKSNGNGRWKWTFGAYGSYQWLKTNGPVYFDDALTNGIATGIRNSMYNAMLSSMQASMMQRGMPEAAARAAAEAAIEKAGGVSMSVAMGAPGLYRTPQMNVGLFHESNIELTHRLIAILGLRYDYNKVKIEYDSRAYMNMMANVMGTSATYALTSSLNGKSDDAYNQLLPKVGLTYRFDDNESNVYATVSKGYRAGGFNIQMFSDILQTELNANRNNAMRGDYDVAHDASAYEKINKTISYEPETSWNYEFGSHVNLFDGTVQFDLAGFYMLVKNQQLSVMAGNYGFGRMMVNAGKSSSCGVEASLRGTAIGGHLNFGLSYGFTHSVFKEYSDSVDGQKIDYEGKKVPFVPAHTIGGMADYRFDFNGKVRSLTVGMNFAAQGKTFWDEENTFCQKLYATLGAHVDLDFSNFKLSFWSRNLTDTQYNTFAFSSAATGKTLFFAQRGNPFQAGVDVKVHF